jgi:hypothetical protein
MRERCELAARFALGCALLQLSGLCAASDAITREIFLRRSLLEPDAITREIFLRYSAQILDAITRELVWLRSEAEPDVISRELVLYRSSGSSIVSREVSVGFVSQVSVIDGFLIREYASLPSGPAEWMSLAVNPGDDEQQNDLLVASTTRQFGAPQDAPDDFLHRVRYGSLDVSLVAAIDSCESDPADMVFDPSGNSLYVAARHRDGFQSGDQGGAILRFDQDGLESGFFDDLGTSHGPLALAWAQPGSSFDAGLYVGNELANALSIFHLDAAGTLQAFSATLSAAIGALAFAPGNAFGELLYVGCEDGAIRTVDPSGSVSLFAAALGAGVQALAFSDEQGFEQMLYALLGNGRIVRLDAAGVAAPFVDGLLIEAIAEGVVRNDLEFAPGNDILYVSDARRAKVYGIQVNPPTAVNPNDPIATRPLLELMSFPNPFNPVTTLRFELATAQTVDLVIHDASGRRVRTLWTREAMKPGLHERRWDGRDNQGRSVGSGVYYALLRSTDSVQSRKLLLLK